MSSVSRSARWAVFGAALLGLLLNDHLLKGAGLLPVWLTGKLSDALGLVVAPVALCWLLRSPGRAGRVACHAAVAAFFVGIELSSGFAAGVEVAVRAVGLRWSLWPDPTDLAALPALALSWWLTAPAARAPAGGPRAARALLGGAGALACLASATPLFHAHAYLVNRTGAPLVVERTPLTGDGSACSGPGHEALRGVPDDWFRDEDFASGQHFMVEPDGVLPLSCLSKVALAKDRRLVFVAPDLPSRALPKVPSREETSAETGLLYVEGNAANPLFRAGPGITLRSIAPAWQDLPRSACADAVVPRLEYGPLVASSPPGGRTGAPDGRAGGVQP